MNVGCGHRIAITDVLGGRAANVEPANLYAQPFDGGSKTAADETLGTRQES
jgi:hypothetical protein